jgi:polyisoprenoid-binding protein YceI
MQSRWVNNLYISAAASAGLVMSTAAFATDWHTDPVQSSLTFTAIQQRAEFQGEFETFSANIHFDPANPETGRIKATIKLASVETQNDERDDYLVLAEWLDVPQWPDSTYQATRIEADGDDWIATGELTLKGVTLPVDLRFSFTEDGAGATFVGTASLKRMDFNVGTGGWMDTRWVGDPVKIMVNLRLTRSNN